jgi:hypothetical protein
MTPYFGLGNRHWTRDSSAHVGGYLENYDHSYFGGGVLLQYSPANGWVFAGYGFGGKTFAAHLATPNYPLLPYYFSFTLGDDTMWMAGVSVDHAINKHLHLNGGADWTHFNYGQSAGALAASPITGRVGCCVSEPDSRTLNMTVKAGFGYAF